MTGPVLGAPAVVIYTDGVVQEPLTRGMRMDRDYRNNHARSMINRFI